MNILIPFEMDKVSSRSGFLGTVFQLYDGLLPKGCNGCGSKEDIKKVECGFYDDMPPDFWVSFRKWLKFFIGSVVIGILLSFLAGSQVYQYLAIVLTVLPMIFGTGVGLLQARHSSLRRRWSLPFQLCKSCSRTHGFQKLKFTLTASLAGISFPIWLVLLVMALYEDFSADTTVKMLVKVLFFASFPVFMWLALLFRKGMARSQGFVAGKPFDKDQVRLSELNAYLAKTSAK